MTVNDGGLVVAANALDTAITHMQAHSAAPSNLGVGSTIGSRVAVNGTVDADGDITWTNVAFTGLGASVAFWGVSYWTASTGGTCYGIQARSGGDTNANAAGEYTWSGAENLTAT
jgi:hypothetical protein